MLIKNDFSKSFFHVVPVSLPSTTSALRMFICTDTKAKCLTAKKELQDTIEKNYLATAISDEMVAFLPHMDKKYLMQYRNLPSHYHVQNIGKLFAHLGISFQSCIVCHFAS